MTNLQSHVRAFCFSQEKKRVKQLINVNQAFNEQKLNLNLRVPYAGTLFLDFLIRRYNI